MPNIQMQLGSEMNGRMAVPVSDGDGDGDGDGDDCLMIGLS